MKKAWYNVNGFEIQQYIIDSPIAVDALIKSAPQMKTLGLDKKFKQYIANGEVVITDIKRNLMGVYSWRTEGIDNWNRLRMVS